jgi:hypothetical protein
MERNWKWSLLQPNVRRAKELPDLDARLLQDVGLKRNNVGQIVLAADPSYVVPGFRRRSIGSVVTDHAYRVVKRLLGRVVPWRLKTSRHKAPACSGNRLTPA